MLLSISSKYSYSKPIFNYPRNDFKRDSNPPKFSHPTVFSPIIGFRGVPSWFQNRVSKCEFRCSRFHGTTKWANFDKWKGTCLQDA
jgi:hypothetical protein